MKMELPKAYDFREHESKIYKNWEEKGYFRPTNDPNLPGFDPIKKPFVIAIPPPNVTGELHLGHPLFVSLQDLMIRYHRMKGEPTLWIPGTDHAGIATQLMVERDLAKQGMKREELGREQFVDHVWEWKRKYGGIITQQIRRLGASCDWSRERFTLDEGLSQAVREAFVRLYEKGLIYQGPRMIIWSPGLMTAISDLEVEYEQEPGKLYYFKYMLADGSGNFIPVATTRPETILGDTAVAVHPEDERYNAMIGKKVLVPMIGREIPVIADAYVEREFGTGALKITPGHDPHDYEIGQRHGLGVINILNKDATMNENAGPYQGLDRFDCRENIWGDMGSIGLVIKEEPYLLNVPRSQRGGEIIEPLVSTQWFVKIEPLAKAALDAVKDGRIKIVPERFTKVYYNWMENIQDWCISRQLWWGHRIPVWYCDTCQAVSVSRTDLVECPKCGSDHFHQDSDVLDTWFSSGLWPFSILGWPEETPDFNYFYPTSVLETGYDILFFWVSRMIMDGIEFTDQVPFHTVYLNGIIRDEKGQKMSKTKNNAIDPLTVIDELGTDALRFTLLVGSTPGNDMSISVKKIEANRNFANKVWNIGRFVIGALEKAPRSAKEKADWSLADSWIWARMNYLIRDVENLFQTHQYGEAGRHIYDFIWGDFADWYLEISKIQMDKGGDEAYFTAYTLARVFDISLRLLHPFTPYVTEAMWGYLKEACTDDFPGFAPDGGWEDALIIAKWPEIPIFEGWEEQRVSDFTLVQEIIRTIRNARAEKKVEPSKKIPATIVAGEKMEILQSQSSNLCAMGGLDASNFIFSKSLEDKNEDDIVLVISGVEIRLPLSGLINHEAELRRIENELKEVEGQILRLETLLSGAFSNKAPAAVVAKEREKLVAYHETAVKLKDQLR